MLALPHRLIVSLAEDDPNTISLIQQGLEQLEAIQKLLVVPDAEQAIAYLQGRGRYADRAAWPLPGVLILDRAIRSMRAIDVLRWLRREPKLATIPVVILGDPIPMAEVHILSRFRAASCAKSGDGAQFLEGLHRAIVTALSLVRQSWFGSRAAYGEPESAALAQGDSIRVWT